MVRFRAFHGYGREAFAICAAGFNGLLDVCSGASNTASTVVGLAAIITGTKDSVGKS